MKNKTISSINSEKLNDLIFLKSDTTNLNQIKIFRILLER